MGKNWRPTIEIAKITKNIGTTRPQTFTYRSWQCPPRSGRRMRHGDEFLAPKRGRVGNVRHVKDAKRRLQRNPTLPRNAPMTVDSRLSQRAARTVVGAAHSLPQNGCERRRTVNSRQTTADFNLALTRPSVLPGRALDARTRAPRAQRRPGAASSAGPQRCEYATGASQIRTSLRTAPQHGLERLYTKFGGRAWPRSAYLRGPELSSSERN